eukprot:COSAG01_NODE_18172_length_1095_cov_4.077309_2_plen_84_part_01
MLINPLISHRSSPQSPSSEYNGWAAPSTTLNVGEVAADAGGPPAVVPPAPAAGDLPAGEGERPAPPPPPAPALGEWCCPARSSA